MLIAIPSENNMVCPHFGHCAEFTIYDTISKSIKPVPSPGHVPGALPVFLKQLGVELVIAGGMGGSAQDLFASQGVKVIVGASGKIDEVIAVYEKGQLVSTGSVCSEHSHAGDCHS
ncbi:MAG: NifB/NifX family molybdenum-iron cluster-binding protein [Syntrophomonadaceae bacterium]|nr:NifB/NifX family molybdenum-iron cluster-binding protein [Syntrophomonadaceae bacterium]